MEKHLTAWFPAGTPPADQWMQSRLYELEFSGLTGRLRHFLRHPLDAVPGHAIGRTFQHAAEWDSPLPVVQQELQGYRDEALQILRGHSLRLLSELENAPVPYVSQGSGRPYEAILKNDFRQAQHQWSRFLEAGRSGTGIPELPASSLPQPLFLPPSRLERSIDALGWAMHPTAARDSIRVVVDGVLGMLRGQNGGSPGQAVRLIDALEIAGERQLQLSQQLRVDAHLLQAPGLPRPDGGIPPPRPVSGQGTNQGAETSDRSSWVRNLTPFVEKLSTRLQFSAADLHVTSTHPLHRILEQHLLVARHPPTLLEESQSRLEIYQMTRDMHRHLLPLRQVLVDEVQTGFTHLPPAIMLEVLQVSALREYIQQSRAMTDELNACPPPVRPLMASGFMHARILEQFGARIISGQMSRDNMGLENAGLEGVAGTSASTFNPPAVGTSAAGSEGKTSPSGKTFGGIPGFRTPGAGPESFSR